MWAEFRKTDLHSSRDALSVTEDFVKVLGTQNVPESSLGQQPDICTMYITNININNNININTDLVLW